MTMTILEDKNLFGTSDFPLIVLLSLAFPIISIEQEDKKRLIFFFDDSPELRQGLQDYYAKKLQVEPTTFFNQQKVIRARINDFKNTKV